MTDPVPARERDPLDRQGDEAREVELPAESVEEVEVPETTIVDEPAAEPEPAPAA